MPYDRASALSIIVEANDEEQNAWAWVIHRVPDRMLILRSRPDYADPDQALEASGLAAAEISRKLGIPIEIGASSDRTSIRTRSATRQIG